MADLTPEQKRKLQEELTKYASEGATDDELREFRNTLVAQFEQQSTSKKKVVSLPSVDGVAKSVRTQLVSSSTKEVDSPEAKELPTSNLLSSVTNAGKSAPDRPKVIVDIAPKESRTITTKGGKEFTVLLPAKGDGDLINPADNLQRELDERLKKTNLTDEDVEYINQFAPAGIDKDLIKAYAHSNEAGELEKRTQDMIKKRANIAQSLSAIKDIYKEHTPEEILTDPKAAADFITHFETLAPPKKAMIEVGNRGELRAESEESYNAREDVRNYKAQKEVFQSLDLDLKDSHVQTIVNKVVDGKLTKEQAYREASKIVNPRAYRNAEIAANPKPKNVWEFAGALIDKATDAITGNDRTLKSVEGQGALAFQHNLDDAITERLNIARKAGDTKEIERISQALPRIHDKDVLYKYPVILEQKMAKEATDFIATKAGATEDSEAEDVPGWYLKLFGGDGPMGPAAKMKAVSEFFKSKGYFDDPRTKDVANALITRIAIGGLGLGADRIGESSMFGSVNESAAQPFVELFKGVGDVSGLRTDKARVAEKMSDEMFPKEAQNLSNSMTITRNIINTTANVAAQAALQYGTMGVGKAMGVADKAARSGAFWTSGSLPAYDQSLKDSYDFIDTPEGRNFYATTVAMFTGASERLFPEIKLLEIPGVKPIFSEIAERLSAGNLTRELSAELLNRAKNNVLDYAGKYVKNVGQEVVEEVATSVFTDANRILWGDKDMNIGKLIGNAGETAYQTAVGTSLIGTWGAYSDVARERNSTYKSLIYDAAVHHDEAEDAIRKGLQNGAYSQSEFDQKIKVLETAKNRLNDLNVLEQQRGKQLDIQQRQVYLANTTAESLLYEELEELVRNNQRPERQEELRTQLRNLHEQADKIFTENLQFDETLSPVVAENEVVPTLEDNASTPTLQEKETSEVDVDTFEDDLDIFTDLSPVTQLTLNLNDDATIQSQGQEQESGTESGANQPIGTAQREQESPGQEEAIARTNDGNSIRSSEAQESQEEEVIPTRAGVSVIRPGGTGVAPITLGGGRVSVIRTEPSRVSVTTPGPSQQVVGVGNVSVILPQQDAENLFTPNIPEVISGTVDENGDLTINRQQDETTNTDTEATQTDSAQEPINSDKANTGATEANPQFEGTYRFTEAQDVSIKKIAINSNIRTGKPSMDSTKKEMDNPSRKPALAYRKGNKTIILDGRARVLAAKARGEKTYPIRYLVDGTDATAKEVANYAKSLTPPQRVVNIRKADVIASHDQADFRQSMMVMLLGFLDGRYRKPLFSKNSLKPFFKLRDSNPLKIGGGITGEQSILERFNIVGEGASNDKVDWVHNFGPEGNTQQSWVEATGRDDMDLMQEVWDMISDYVLPYTNKKDAVHRLTEELGRETMTSSRARQVEFFSIPQMTEEDKLFMSTQGLTDLLMEVAFSSPEFDEAETRLINDIIEGNSSPDGTTDFNSLYNSLFESGDPDTISLANKITAYATSKEREYNRATRRQEIAANQEGEATGWRPSTDPDFSFSRTAAEGFRRLTAPEAKKVSDALKKAFGIVVNISNDFYAQVDRAMAQSRMSIEAQNVSMQLEKAQQVLEAARHSFNAKRNELNKTTRADQEDLFGNRASAATGGMFDTRIDPAARETAIKPYSERYEKAKAAVNKLNSQLADLLRTGGTSQTAMFSFDGQKVLGFVDKKGVVYLNPDEVRADTPVHEIGGHILYRWAKQNNPELHAKILDVARSAPQELKDFVSANYPELDATAVTEKSVSFDDFTKGSMIHGTDEIGKLGGILNKGLKKGSFVGSQAEGYPIVLVYPKNESVKSVGYNPGDGNTTSTVTDKPTAILFDRSQYTQQVTRPKKQVEADFTKRMNELKGQNPNAAENVQQAWLETDPALSALYAEWRRSDNGEVFNVNELEQQVIDTAKKFGIPVYNYSPDDDGENFKVNGRIDEGQEAFLEEVFATAMGWNEANVRRSEAIATAPPPSLINKIKDIWNDFVNWLIDNSKIAEKYLTVRINEADYRDMSLSDFTTFLGEKMFTGRRIGMPPSLNVRASSTDFSFLGDSDFIYDAFGNIIDVKPDVKAGIFHEKTVIKQRAIAHGNFMLAPDGSRSNLSEDQWLTTQTYRFMEWEKGIYITPIFNQLQKDATGIFGEVIKDYAATPERQGELFQMLVDQSNTSSERAGLKKVIGPAAFKTLMDFRNAKGNALRTITGDPVVMYLDEDNTDDEADTVYLKNAGDKPVFIKANRVLNVDTPEGLTMWSNANSINPDNPEDVLLEAGYDTLMSNNGANVAVMNADTKVKSAVNNSTFSQESSDVRFQRIGANAARLTGMQRNNLEVAQQLEERGSSAQQIFMATGWARGPIDKQWRYELSNQGIEFEKYPPKEAKLGDVLKYPELYEAYPEARNIQVKTLPAEQLWKVSHPHDKSVPDFAELLTSWGGIVDMGDGKFIIYLNSDITPSNKYITIRHEIQHYIQHREGFTLGGNIEIAQNHYTAKLANTKKAIDDFDNALYVVKKRVNEFEKLNKSGVLPPDGIAVMNNFKQRMMYLEEQIATLQEEVNMMEDNKKFYLQHIYENFAGEKEASAVSERGMLSESLRLSSFMLAPDEYKTFPVEKLGGPMDLPALLPTEQTMMMASVRPTTLADNVAEKEALTWQRHLIQIALDGIAAGQDLSTYFESERILSMVFKTDSLSKLEPKQLKVINVIKQMNAEQLNLLLSAANAGLKGNGRADYEAAYQKVKPEIIKLKTKKETNQDKKPDPIQEIPAQAVDSKEIARQLAELYNPVVGSSPFRANTTLEEAGIGDRGRPAYGSETTIALMVRDKMDFIARLEEDTDGKAVHHLLAYLGFDKNKSKKADDLEGQIPSTGNDYQLANVLIAMLEKSPYITGVTPMQKRAYVKYLKNVSKSLGRNFGQALNTAKFRKVIEEVISDEIIDRTMSNDERQILSEAEDQIADILAGGAEHVSDEIIRLRTLNDRGYTFYVNVPNEGERKVSIGEVEAAFKSKRGKKPTIIARLEMTEDELLTAEMDYEKQAEQSKILAKVEKLEKKKDVSLKRSAKVAAKLEKEIKEAEKKIKDLLKSINC